MNLDIFKSELQVGSDGQTVVCMKSCLQSNTKQAGSSNIPIFLVAADMDGIRNRNTWEIMDQNHCNLQILLHYRRRNWGNFFFLVQLSKITEDKKVRKGLK